MSAYRKKPVVVEAVQFTRAMVEADLFDSAPLPAGVERYSAAWHAGRREIHFARYRIQTLEGPMEVTPGDWVVTGIAGERYPCKPDIFAATYEPEGERCWFREDAQPCLLRRGHDGACHTLATAIRGTETAREPTPEESGRILVGAPEETPAPQPEDVILLPSPDGDGWVGTHPVVGQVACGLAFACGMAGADERAREELRKAEAERDAALRRAEELRKDRDYCAREMDRKDVEVQRLTEERDALAKFKAYVHRRLDEAGIPTHPNGPHSAQGCRIGDRLDLVFGSLSSLRGVLERVRPFLAFAANDYEDGLTEKSALRLLAAVDAALAAPSKPSEPAPDINGVWRCEDCGEMFEGEPSWRWTGERWEHSHGQAGHIAARYFGPKPPPSEPEGITPEELERIEKDAAANPAPNLRKAMERRRPSEPEGRCEAVGSAGTRCDLPAGHGGEHTGIMDPRLFGVASRSTWGRADAAPPPPAKAETQEDAPLFVIRKRGLFWAPDAHGYTSSFLNAGVYDKAEADSCRLNPDNTVLPLAEALTKYAPPSGPVHPRSVAGWLAARKSQDAASSPSGGER